MGAHVYVLKLSSGRLYYGSTTDLPRRLQQHKDGHTKTTARDIPIEVVASYLCSSLKEARELERMFKKWKNPSRILNWLSRQQQT